MPLSLRSQIHGKLKQTGDKNNHRIVPGINEETKSPSTPSTLCDIQHDQLYQIA